MTEWQLQEAKQKLSELVKRAEHEGPQLVTRHGEGVAVVLSVGDYERLVDARPGFKEFLTQGPGFDGLAIRRSKARARKVEF